MPEAAEEEELSLLDEAKGFVDEAKAAQAADLEEAADIMGKDDLSRACSFIFAIQVPQSLLLLDPSFCTRLNALLQKSFLIEVSLRK